MFKPFFTLTLVSNSILICDDDKNFIDSSARPQINKALTRIAREVNHV